MDEWIHGRPPRENEPDCIVVWVLFKAHSGARKAARSWQEYVRNEVFMSAGWNAEVLDPSAYHKADDLNDNDDTSTYGHSDSFMVELRIDVFQDVKAMNEHEVDIEVLMIVKQVSSWRPAGITWVRLENTAATTKTMRNTSMSYLCIAQRRDQWLGALQSISYSIGWTLLMTSER